VHHGWCIPLTGELSLLMTPFLIGSSSPGPSAHPPPIMPLNEVSRRRVPIIAKSNLSAFSGVIFPCPLNPISIDQFPLAHPLEPLFLLFIIGTPKTLIKYFWKRSYLWFLPSLLRLPIWWNPRPYRVIFSIYLAGKGVYPTLVMEDPSDFPFMEETPPSMIRDLIHVASLLDTMVSLSVNSELMEPPLCSLLVDQLQLIFYLRRDVTETF
jgi:hypothetical protein